MSTLTIAEVQSQLPRIIDQLRPGDAIVILRDNEPVARLLPPEPKKGTPVYGRGKGKVVRVIDDDDHLKEFSEYLD